MPDPRISQEVLEVLVKPDTVGGRLSQHALEVLVKPDTVGGRLSQVAVEVLVTPLLTRWYIQNATPTVTPTLRGTWTGAHVTTAILVMDDEKFGDHAICGGDTPTGVGSTYWAYQVVGPALAAQTVEGILTGVIPVGVVVMNDGDFHFRIHAYVRTPTDSVRGTLVSDSSDTHPGDEWSVESSTTTRGRTLLQRTLTPVSCLDGDRIVVEIGSVRVNGGAIRNVKMGYGAVGIDLASGALGNSGPGWIQIDRELALSIGGQAKRSYAIVMG